MTGLIVLSVSKNSQLYFKLMSKYGKIYVAIHRAEKPIKKLKTVVLHCS